MKKVFLLVTFGVSGIISANTIKVQNDLLKIISQNVVDNNDVAQTSCLIYKSSCGEAGFFCKDELCMKNL